VILYDEESGFRQLAKLPEAVSDDADFGGNSAIIFDHDILKGVLDTLSEFSSRIPTDRLDAITPLERGVYKDEPSARLRMLTAFEHMIGLPPSEGYNVELAICQAVRPEKMRELRVTLGLTGHEGVPCAAAVEEPIHHLGSLDREARKLPGVSDGDNRKVQESLPDSPRGHISAHNNLPVGTTFVSALRQFLASIGTLISRLCEALRYRK